jgi:hypothetical protein
LGNNRELVHVLKILECLLQIIISNIDTNAKFRIQENQYIDAPLFSDNLVEYLNPFVLYRRTNLPRNLDPDDGAFAF